MSNSLDLDLIFRRESEQVEWKKGVADIDEVVKTLSAFANDLANVGGGYLACGVAEGKDEYGYVVADKVGLTHSELEEIKGEVLTRCRDLVSPAITPQVFEVEAKSPSRRILVFVQPTTLKAHTFTNRKDEKGCFIRNARETIEAKNGILLELLSLRGEVPPWDLQPVEAATSNDIDLVVLREVLNRIKRVPEDAKVDVFLSDTRPINALIPPLMVKEPLTGILRPRRFAMLLFGREVQRFILSAVSLYSVYPGVDRSESHSERHEIIGTIFEQATKLRSLLQTQCVTQFDKTNLDRPNSVRYPEQALIEAMVNVLAHRDYQNPNPVRITAFSDRIEMVSPGGLLRAVPAEGFAQGKASSTWRSTALAWFLKELQLAQVEGQGLPTIKRRLRDNENPDPTFEVGPEHVRYIIPARLPQNVDHTYQTIRRLILIGNTDEAVEKLDVTMRTSGINSEALRLFEKLSRSMNAKSVARHARRALDHFRGNSINPRIAPDELLCVVAAIRNRKTTNSSLRELSRQLVEDARRSVSSASEAIAFLEKYGTIHPIDAEETAFLLEKRFPSLIGMPEYHVTILKIAVESAKVMVTTIHSHGIDAKDRSAATAEAEVVLARISNMLESAESWSRDQRFKELADSIRQEYSNLRKRLGKE